MGLQGGTAVEGGRVFWHTSRMQEHKLLLRVLGGTNRPGGAAFAESLRDAGGAMVLWKLGEATDLVLANGDSLGAGRCSRRERASELAHDALNLCHCYLHHGRWQDVKVVWREAYAWAGIICAAVASKQSESLRFLDLALLMAGPSHRCVHSPSLFKYVEALERGISGANGANSGSDSSGGGGGGGGGGEMPRQVSDGFGCDSDGGEEGRKGEEEEEEEEEEEHTRASCAFTTMGEILILSLPSLAEFQARVLDTARPAILERCIDHWPAVWRWRRRRRIMIRRRDFRRGGGGREVVKMPQLGVKRKRESMAPATATESSARFVRRRYSAWRCPPLTSHPQSRRKSS